MDIFLYIIFFIMGITFGSFYTLAVYRIPKKQDITHTHSYCPNCNHKLGILDLIPVFSYIFLGAKCRYCGQKIRPRYFILETLSGVMFIIFAYLLKMSVYDMNKIVIFEYCFLILYFTFIVLMAGIDKEKKNINKSVLVYGIVISMLYMIYLYIIENASIDRYVIYLLISILFLWLAKNIKKESNIYAYSIVTILMIMTIFTGEWTTIMTSITTLLALLIYKLIKKIIMKKKEKEPIPIGFFLAFTNILYMIIFMLLFRIC